MKAIFGILLIIAGVGLGLYLGVYVMFIGGIIDLVEFVKQGLADVVKLLFASFIGVVSAMALIIPGYAMVAD